MGFIYSSLKKGAGEGVAQFENRIARMLPFASGKAYFDLRNYDAQTGEFGVYIEWDSELDTVFGYSLPTGGYFVKATLAQAYSLHRLDRGLAVYMKLVYQCGRLYPYRTYVMMDGRPFSVEFGGGVLIPFEDRYEELGCMAAIESQPAAGSQRFLAGGSGVGRMQSGSQGSYRYLTGSQRFLSGGSGMRRMLSGSQGSYRYLAGSQRFLSGGSGMRRMLSGSQGSYRYLAGSQRFLPGGSGMRRMLSGSQGSYRYLAGSQRFLFGGSGMRRMLNGSQRRAGYKMAESGANSAQQPHDNTAAVKISQELLAQFPQEWQLINRGRRPAGRVGGNARFGYGLDLI